MNFKLSHLIAFVFVSSIFLCASQQASACTCPVPGPLEKESVKSAKEEATAVFSGEVTSIDLVQLEGTGVNKTLPDGSTEFILPQYERWVTFKIIDVWKGDVVSGRKMRDRQTDCDFHFEAGKSYLVYAYGKVLTTNICSRTALIDAKNTRKEIKILNKLRD